MHTEIEGSYLHRQTSASPFCYEEKEQKSLHISVISNMTGFSVGEQF